MKVKKNLIAAAVASVTLLSGLFAPVPAVFAEDETEIQPRVTAEGADEEVPAIWLQVSPVSNRVILNAGEELTYIFNVDNIGADEFTFKVYATPYYVINEAYDVDFTSETARTQISRWLTFRGNGSDDAFAAEKTFTIAAGARQSVEYKVSVPADVPAGGQYAAIVSEYVPTGSSNATGVQTVPRVNMIIYGTTTGDTVDEGNVVEHKVPGFLTSGKIGMTSLVNNSGNTDFAARYQFKVSSIFGQSIYEKTSSFDVLPETSRRVEMDWDETPAFGIFHADSTITFLGDTDTQSKIVLIVPLFVIIVMIILLTILIVWLIIIIRKRQTRRSKVIV